VVIQPTALFKRGVEQAFLLMSWVDSVRKHLMHRWYCCISTASCQAGIRPTPCPIRNVAFIPRLKWMRLSAAEISKGSFCGRD
jgi:hypothetical protein